MVTKTCQKCGEKFECGKGTRKPLIDKFCSMACAEKFYEGCESAPPPRCGL